MVTRIPEELEFAPSLLEFLEESSLIPGTDAKVITKSPDGTATIEIDGQVIGISAFTAELILVTTS